MNEVTVIHMAYEESPVTVAKVRVGDRKSDEALSYAYEKTNNIEGSWSLPKYVKRHTSRQFLTFNKDYSKDVDVVAELPAPNLGLRSTSVGDLLVFKGETFKVDNVGFTNLGAL